MAKNLSRQPGEGQFGFDGSEFHDSVATPEAAIAARAVINLNALNSLSRTLTPEYLHIDPAEYDDVTPQMLDLVGVTRLGVSLMGSGISLDSSNAILYHKDDSKGRSRAVVIAIPPAEHRILNGAPEGLAKQAHNTTYSSRPDKSDADLAASRRAADHALSPKKAKMQNLSQTLAAQREILDKFAEAAKYPGLARFGNEGKMRAAFSYLEAIIIPDMMLAIGQQRDWTASQRELATRAVVKRMVLARENNGHIRYFRQFIGMANQYNQRRQDLCLERMQRTDAALEQYVR